MCVGSSLKPLALRWCFLFFFQNAHSNKNPFGSSIYRSSVSLSVVNGSSCDCCLDPLFFAYYLLLTASLALSVSCNPNNSYAKARTHKMFGRCEYPKKRIDSIERHCDDGGGSSSSSNNNIDTVVVSAIMLFRMKNKRFSSSYSFVLCSRAFSTSLQLTPYFLDYGQCRVLVIYYTLLLDTILNLVHTLTHA